MMMNGGAAGFLPSSSDGGAWEQQEYDAHSSSTEHNTNHYNWGSSAAVSSSSATQQGGGGGGMSAEDTRRLMESLASQLEPNPLRSGGSGSGSGAQTCTTDGTFCMAASGSGGASSSMPLMAFDDHNRSDTAATASHLPQQQYHMAQPHPFSNHSQQQQQQPRSVSMQYQLQQQQQQLQQQLQQQQQQQASSSSTYPSEYGDYGATSPTSAVSASMSDMMTMSAASMAQPQQGVGLQAAPSTTKDDNNKSGNCNHGNGNGNGGADQNNVVAAFTEQDEKDELATLTIQEILDAEQDVRGQLADAMAGLSVTTTTAGGASGAGTSTRTTTAAMGKAAVTSSSSCSISDSFRQSSTAPTAAAANANALTPPHPHPHPQLSIEETSALLLLRAELLRIPPHQKRSYTDAVQRCPDQTDQQVQLAYLRRDGYDAHVAAGRIVQYWENRLAVFGEDRCYLPMTLDGAAREEVGDMRSESLTYSTTVLPVRDANGRAVVYVKANRMGRTDALGMEKMMRAFWYVLDTAASSSDGLQNGFVVVVNGTDVQRRHFSVKVFRLIRQLLWDILPTKAKCTHLCHPSKVNYYIVQPLVRAVFGKELRIRQRVHYGTTEKVLNELRQYALPPEVIPQDMGGQLQLNFEQHILELALAERRDVLQGSGALVDVLSMPMPVASTSNSPMDMSDAADAALSNKRDDNIRPDAFRGPSTARSSRSSTGGRKRRSGTTTNGKAQRTNNRKGRSGRKSDPRMQRAVQIKLDNPDTPLKEALQMGGFDFHLKNPAGGQTDKNLIDTQGVSLSQHKNNLCRRLRQEKAAASGKSNNSEGSAGPVVVSGSARLSSAAEDAAASAAAAQFAAAVGNSHASCENFGRPTRRDSFDEAIAEIPQIEVDEVFE